jgi:spore cortex-lytic enzyme
MKKIKIFISITLITILLISFVFIDAIYAGTLYWGSRGSEVSQVQTRLKRWGYYKGDIDGIYGNETYTAIIDFQKKNGLKTDGTVGIQTKQAMGIMTTESLAVFDQIVEFAQQKLKQWGYYYGAIDGIYGSKTYEAVIDFQIKNGLMVDGIIGPSTRSALGINQNAIGPSYSSTSRGVSRSGDIQLLAMAIHGEARGEPYVGQVAVGAVILNRVRHPSFPNTVAGVIYQPRAFTAVDDGQMYLAPNDVAYKAASDALNGWDPTGGAIYYWNPVTATSQWIWTRTPSLKIGKHFFAK